MPFVPLDIPAGVYKNGTDLEGQGRWQNASLVRWRDNTMRPVGGWENRLDDGSSNMVLGENYAPNRGAHAWRTNDGNAFLAAGSYIGASEVSTDGFVVDIKPVSGYTSGRNYTNASGEATTWSMDNWGQNLVAVASHHHQMYYQNVDAELFGTIYTSNSGFDSGLTDWTPTGSAWDAWTQSGETTARYRSNSQEPITQVVTGLTVGKIYQLTVNHFGDVNGTVILAYVDGVSTSLYEQQYSSGSGNAQTTKVTFTATETSVTVGVIPYYRPSGYYYINDVTLKLYGEALQEIPNAPECSSLVVTEERFLFALGAYSDDIGALDQRLVKWCDREDFETWTPSATNEAGDIILQTSGRIMQGVSTSGQTLILTDTDAHAATYQGPPYVYGFRRVGTACGTISRLAAVNTEAGVFWMGQSGFFNYNGNTVQQLPCDVFDHVFGEIDEGQSAKVWAWSNSEHGEVWWFYQSSGQTEPAPVDKYVAFDYIENHWMIGSLNRNAGVPRGVFDTAILMDDDNYVYNHELKSTGPNGAFAETSPIQIGNGDNVMHITQVIPDEKTQGDVSLKLKTKFYPNGTETTHGPFDPANPTSLRVTGRQVKLRADADNGADFRLGIVRLDVTQGGRR